MINVHLICFSYIAPFRASVCRKSALTTSESFRKLLNMSKRCNDALQPLLLNG